MIFVILIIALIIIIVIYANSQNKIIENNRTAHEEQIKSISAVLFSNLLHIR